MLWPAKRYTALPGTIGHRNLPEKNQGEIKHRVGAAFDAQIPEAFLGAPALRALRLPAT